MLRFAHRWLGVLLCSSILVISVTGVLLVWKKEFLWLSFAESRTQLQTDSASLASSIEKIEASYTKNPLSLIQLHSEGLALHKAYLYDGQVAWHDQSGVKLGQWQANGRFEEWLLDLHHRFLLGNRIGLNIAGFSGLLLIPLVLLGLVLWWPRRRSLSEGLLPHNLHKAELIRSHSNLGLLSFLPVLIIAITGVILVYPEQTRQVLVEPFSDENDYEAQDGPVDSTTGAEHASWLRVIERSRLLYPNADIRWVTPASFFSAHRIVGLQQKGDWNRTGKTTVYIEAAGGYMDVNLDELRKSKIERTYNLAYSLHAGKFTIWYRLFLSVVGIAMTLIAIFGMVSFFRKNSL